MNTHTIKYIIPFLVWIACSNLINAQEPTYVKMSGDTYTIHMIEGWYKCTGEILAKGPARKKMAGYETTWTTRICPDNDGSIAITEFKGCKDCRQIQKQDSLEHAINKQVRTVTWSMPKASKVKYSVDVFYHPAAHPETGKKEELRIRDWYVCGKNNTYLISYATTSISAWNKWLPEMEKLVISLQEK